jgi:hypothetical protein
MIRDVTTSSARHDFVVWKWTWQVNALNPAFAVRTLLAFNQRLHRLLPSPDRPAAVRSSFPTAQNLNFVLRQAEQLGSGRHLQISFNLKIELLPFGQK